MIEKQSSIQAEIRESEFRKHCLAPPHFAGRDGPSNQRAFREMTRQKTRHFGAFEGGHLQGIASVFRVKMPERPGSPLFNLGVWQRLRRPVGRPGVAPLQGLAWLTRRKTRRPDLVHARKTAVGFYQRLGFTILGRSSSFHDVGPHFRMFLLSGNWVMASPACWRSAGNDQLKPEGSIFK